MSLAFLLATPALLDRLAELPEPDAVALAAAWVDLLDGPTVALAAAAIRAPRPARRGRPAVRPS